MMRVESKCTCTLYVAHSNESSGIIDWTWIDRSTITKRSKIAGTDTIDRSYDRSIASPRTIEFFVHPPTHAPVAALADWRGRDSVFLFPLFGFAFLFSFHFETVKDVRRGGRTRAHATPHWIIYKDRGWTHSMDAFSTRLPHNIRALNSNNRILLFPDVLSDRHHASEPRMRNTSNAPTFQRFSLIPFSFARGRVCRFHADGIFLLRYHLSVIIYLGDFVNLGCSCESIRVSYICVGGVYYTTMSRNEIDRAILEYFSRRDPRFLIHRLFLI